MLCTPGKLNVPFAIPFVYPLVRTLPTLSVKPDYRRSDSQNSPQIIAQEKRLGLRLGLQHKECITIKIFIEFSPSPKYIFVNRKNNVLLTTSLGVGSDGLCFCLIIFAVPANTFYVFCRIPTHGNFK